MIFEESFERCCERKRSKSFPRIEFKDPDIFQSNLDLLENIAFPSPPRVTNFARSRNIRRKSKSFVLNFEFRRRCKLAENITTNRVLHYNKLNCVNKFPLQLYDGYIFSKKKLVITYVCDVVPVLIYRARRDCYVPCLHGGGNENAKIATSSSSDDGYFAVYLN